jgi:drug/metabolite transporter (DMT)-like permease
VKVTKQTNKVVELGLFLTAVTWGSTFFIIKDSVAHLSPVTLVAYRFLAAAIILGLYLTIKKQSLVTGLKYGLTLGVLLFLTYVPQAVGLKYISASNSGFITGTFVAFIPIFSLFFFKTKTTWNKWLAVIISLVGLTILTGGLSTVGYGDGITLVTAMAIALHLLLADKYVKLKSPLVLAFQQFTCTGIASLLLAVLSHASFRPQSTTTILSVAYLTLLPSLGAYVVQFLAQKKVTAVKIALIFALEPVFAAIFSWTIGGERFVLSHALGGLLIFIAIVISELNFSKRNNQDLDEDLCQPLTFCNTLSKLFSRSFWWSDCSLSPAA